MKTFNQWISINNLNESIVSKINKVVLEAEKNEEFKELLSEDGIWDNIKQFGQNVVNNASNAWNNSTTKQALGNASGAFMQTYNGPVAMYNKALVSLNSVLVQMKNNPKLANVMTTGDAHAGFPPMKMIDWLNKVIKELNSQVDQLKSQSDSGSASPVVSNPSQPMGQDQITPSQNGMNI